MEQIMVMDVTEYMRTTTRIKENLAGIVDRFVYVGWLLNRIAKSEGYKHGGYDSIADYAKKELGGMTADTVSRFINVFRTYGAGEETPELKEEYKTYKYSMLVEMLQLPDEDRALISADTPRAVIRDLNKFNAEQEKGTDVLMGWQQDTADLVRTAVKALSEQYEQEKLREILDREDIRTKDLPELMAPSGNKTYKKGTVFMIMTTEKVNIKIFGRENQELTWTQMAELLAEALPVIEQEETTVEEIPPEDITIEDPDQIPGQDSVLNHPEYMPEPTEPEIAPAQKPKQKKTEEQKYAEKQAKIDRQTEQKLQEMEDAEKLEHLPSMEGQRVKQLRIGFSYYQEMTEQGRNFDLTKKADYRVGDLIDYMVFEKEKFTGKSIKKEITFILDEATGMEDGWCILGLK